MSETLNTRYCESCGNILGKDHQRFCCESCYTAFIQKTRPRATTQCLTCNTPLNETQIFFCSDSCNRSFKGKASFTCLTCNSTFFVTKSVLGNPRFRGLYCSRSCMKTAVQTYFPRKEETRLCKECGNSFTTKKKTQEFCSADCVREFFKRFPGWAKGIKRSEEFRKKCSASTQGVPLEEWEGFVGRHGRQVTSTAAYKTLKRQAFIRDDFTCQECGEKSGKLECHHIIPVRLDESKELDVNNLITLCHSCHKKTRNKEEDFIEKYTNKLLEKAALIN